MYVLNYMHAWCLRMSEESIGSPGIGVIDSCELPCGYHVVLWKSQHQALLTTEPSLCRMS